jgi:hypothetical protein
MLCFFALFETEAKLYLYPLKLYELYYLLTLVNLILAFLEGEGSSKKWMY